MPFKPLACKTVRCALDSLGFTQQPQTSGTTHEKWTAMIDSRKRVVTVDCHRGEVRALDVKSIIGQAGVSKDAFWSAVAKC